MLEQDEESHEQLLQSALATSFTPISLSTSEPESSSEPVIVPPASTEPETTVEEEKEREPAQPIVSPGEYAKWNEEYEEMDRSWKAESAARRAEIDERDAKFEAAGAEKTWEKLEDIQGPPNPLLNDSHIEVGDLPPVKEVETQPAVAAQTYPDEPCPADVRDLTTGEPEGSKPQAQVIAISEASAQNEQSQLSQSQRWTDIDSDPSLESSFPSLSFPSQPHSQSDSTSPSHTRLHSLPQSSSHHQHHHHHSEKDTNHTHHHKREEKVTPPATPAIFDSRLTTQSRLLALGSSLAINLLLPFVNGMMLGFGEIFGRALLTRFGWRVPGGAATAVGVNAAPKSR